MPNGDRTGPQGQGPMTGRGQGVCAGNESPRFGRGGRGRGRGQGEGGRGNGGRGQGGGMRLRRRDGSCWALDRPNADLLLDRIEDMSQQIVDLRNELNGKA